jgi:hypothetical protein
MNKVILAIIAVLLAAAPAFAQTHVSPSEDAFTDSFYLNEAEGTTHPDKLWAGATVNYEADPPVIDGTEFTRSYLKFDLSGYTNIDRAYLWLYRVDDNWSYNNPDQGNVTVYRENEDWSESTITWANAPDFANNTQGPRTYINQPDGGWVSWNVTSFAKSAQGGNLSLVLAGSEPFHIFESSESPDGHFPYLNVNVVPEPVSCLLFGIGALTLAATRRAKKKLTRSV